ncbi:MAG: chemotaxis protein CheX [Desulfosalsimonas sp.]
MEEKDGAILVSVFSSVFEEFAFMFVEEAEDDAASDPGDPCPCLLAGIRFSGRQNSGVLEVAAPAELCEELAENILGLEQEELPEEASENALTELLNVSCGYFLAEKFGTDEVFDLSIPETREISGGQWAEMSGSGGWVNLEVEETPLMARAEIR